MNKYIIGGIAGAASLAVAFPLVAQFVSAASGTAATANDVETNDAPAPSQACVQALADRDGKFLASIDAMITAQKAATQAHKDALTAAVAITDDTQRAAAVDAADKAFGDAMKAAFTAHGDPKTEMDAVKTACGEDGFRHKFGAHFGFGGPMMRGDGPHMRHDENDDNDNNDKETNDDGPGADTTSTQDGQGRGQSLGSNSEGK